MQPSTHGRSLINARVGRMHVQPGMKVTLPVTARTHGDKRDAYSDLIGKPEGNKDLNVIGRIILKTILG